MRNKTLIGLGIAAIVAIGAAALVVGSRSTDETGEMKPTLLFPGLGAKVGDIAGLTVAGAKQTVTIVKAGDDWQVKEKSNYPAKADALKSAIAGLVELRAVEPRTDKPDLYGKIGVEDIDKPDAKSIRVTLADGGGKELAALLVGNTKAYESGSHPAQLYVRKPGEARSWLAEGRLEIKTDPMTWVDRELTKINRDRIMSIAIVQPDGSKVVQTKAKPKDEDWQVDGLPAGAKPKTTDLNGSGSALEYLTCEDLAKAADVAFDKPVVATFRTFDGLVVTVKGIKKDGKPWIQLGFAYDAAQATKFAAAQPVPAKADDKDAKDKDAKAAESTPPAATKPPAEVEKEAAALQARFGPWAYQIPDYQATNYMRTPAETVMSEKKEGG